MHAGHVAVFLPLLPAHTHPVQSSTISDHFRKPAWNQVEGISEINVMIQNTCTSHI